MAGLSRRSIIKAAGASAAGLAAGAAGLSIISRPRPEHFFLIVADAMRADVVGKVVNGREVTPNVNRIAAGGLCFENAYSAAPGTKFSMASILSGMYPPGHGVEHPRFTLPECTTLQGFLKSHGSFTAGVVTNPYLAPEIGPESSLASMGFGFNAGFDCYRAAGGADAARRKPPPHLAILDAFPDGLAANRVLRALIERRAPAAGRGSLFAYIHYMDSHQPWVKPWPLDGVTGAFHDGAPADAEAVHAADAALVKAILFDAEPKKRPSGADLARLRAIYLESCAWTDRCIGELLEFLDAAGYLDGATLMITADHGEEFMEHGCIGHAQNLYDTALRVPLVIARPSCGSRKAGARVSNAQILPSVMGWFDCEATSTNLPPLEPYLSGGLGDAEIFASFYGRDKVITPGGAAVMDEGGYVRFDIEKDPSEGVPLRPDEDVLTALEKARAVSERLAREAGVERRWSTYAWQNPDVDVQNRAAVSLVEAGEISEKEAARLKSLGRFLPEGAGAELTLESRIDPAGLSESQRGQLKALGYLN